MLGHRLLLSEKTVFYCKITSLLLVTSHAKSVLVKYVTVQAICQKKKADLASKVSGLKEKLNQGYCNDAYKRFTDTKLNTTSSL